MMCLLGLFCVALSFVLWPETFRAQFTDQKAYSMALVLLVPLISLNTVDTAKNYDFI